MRKGEVEYTCNSTLNSPLGFTEAIRAKGVKAIKQKAASNEFSKPARQYIKDTLEANLEASLSFLVQRLDA